MVPNEVLECLLILPCDRHDLMHFSDAFLRNFANLFYTYTLPSIETDKNFLFGGIHKLHEQLRVLSK